MTQIRRRTLLAGALAAPAAVQAAPTAPGTTPTARAQAAAAFGEAIGVADAWLDAACRYDAVPCLSVVVLAAGRPVWSKGYGTSGPGVPAAADTLYPIGSVTKMFTAVAAMQLVEAGTLELDAPITARLPWAAPKAAAPGGGPITLRALLSHSSGLPRDVGPCWTAPDFPFPSREDLKAAVRGAVLRDPPLTRFAYSNLGYALIGEMIEAATRRGWAEVVQARVVTPMGLLDTRFAPPGAELGRRLPHGFGARRADGSRAPLPLVDVKAYAPAAAMTSTAGDLAVFAAWQMASLAGDGAGILKPETLREMQRPQYADPGAEAGVGLGFIVARQGQEAIVGHDGEVPGYRTNLWTHSATGTGVAVVRDTSDGSGPYAMGVLGLIKARFAAPAPPPGPAVDLAAYAGRYSEQPWGGEGLVAPWAGRLAYVSAPTDAPGGGLALFDPVSPDLFRRRRSDGSLAEEVRFRRDGAGRVQDFVQHDNPHHRLA